MFLFFSCSVRLPCYCIMKTQDCSFAIFRQTHNSIVPIYTYIYIYVLYIYIYMYIYIYVLYIYIYIYMYIISQGGHTSLNPLDRVNHTLCQAGENKYVSSCPEEPAKKLNKSVGPFLQVLQTLPFPYKKMGFMEAAWEAALCFYIYIYVRLYKNSCQWKSGVPMFGMEY